MQLELKDNEFSQEDFDRLSKLIEGKFGIKMPKEKKLMLESRLMKRLRSLGLNNFTDYCSFLFSDDGMKKEVPVMIDLVSTNKTDFFREADHFKLLYNNIIPQIVEGNPGKRINIWSAGCSSGEEPYTIAIVFKEYQNSPNIVTKKPDFIILATDISSKVLKEAEEAIYDSNDIKGIPEIICKKYLLKNKDRSKEQYRINPIIREKVLFHRINLMDQEFPLNDHFHIIFCRNVMIYFKREIQYELLKKFSLYLFHNGYLFIGHSETMINMDLPFKMIAPGIYQKTGE